MLKGRGNLKTDKNILIAFLLNIFFSIFEFIGGLITGSVAILSDSIHDFGDAISIGISYFLEKKSKKESNDIYTYGYIKYSVLGSIITTVILIVGSIFMIYESIKRLVHPVSINYNGMLILAIIGVLVNLVAVFYTNKGKSLNQKAVNLHMLEDVFGWIIVLIGSIVMRYTNISVIDSILSLIVALFILLSAIHNMREVLDIFLEKTPEGITIDDIKKHLMSINGIIDIHHVHIRTIDGYNNFATLHVVSKKYSTELKNKIKEELSEHGINHSTIEFELEKEKCADEVCHPNNNGDRHRHHH